MPSLKMQFKLEVIEKIIKSHPNQMIFYEEYQSNKLSSNDLSSKHNTTITISSNFTLSNNSHLGITKTKFAPHSKYSVRTAKPYTGDFETLPGYDNYFSSMSPDEKEEALAYMKTIEPTLLYQLFSIMNSTKNMYSKLKSKQGLEVIKNIYKSIIQKNKNDSKINSVLNEINDECELYIYLQDVLNINDIDACEIYNLFKYNNFFSFSISHFILLIYLYYAFESKELEDYFTLFGDDLFKEISANENYITVSRMKNIGNIIGIKEKEMNSIINEMNYSIYTEIDNEKFKEFYKKVGKKIKGESNMNNNNFNLNFLKNAQSTNTTNSSKEKNSFTMGYGKFHFKRK